MYDDLKRCNINVILIQLDEAHSSAWPMGLKEQPDPQTDFKCRMDRAKLFVEKYNCPFNVYVDGWDNMFENTFRAWPDKFYLVDFDSDNDEYIIECKSEYNGKGEKEAVIIYDYVNVLEDLIKLH